MRKILLPALFLVATTIGAQDWVNMLADIDRGSINANYEASDSENTRYDINDIIRQSEDIQAVNNDGDSFLVAAIKKGFWGDLETIVKAGFKVDKKDKNGKIPLHHLVETWLKIDGDARYENVNIFALHTLPIHEAELLTQDSAGNTPLSLWFQKPDIDFSYRIDREQRKSANQVNFVGVNGRSFVSAPKKWQDGIKSSLFGFFYAISDLAKPVQITKTKKMTLFNYCFELIKNDRDKSEAEQIVKLYLDVDKELKIQGTFQDKVVQQIYEDQYFWEDGYGSSELVSDRLQPIIKWLGEKSKDLTVDQKLSILTFFNVYPYVKSFFTYSEATKQMAKEVEGFYDLVHLADNFWYSSFAPRRRDSESIYTYSHKVFMGKSNRLLLFKIEDNSESSPIFGYDISSDSQAIGSDFLMPTFDGNGNFVRSKLEIENLIEVSIYGVDQKPIGSALVGLSEKGTYLLDLENKQLIVSKDKASLPPGLYRFKGVLYVVRAKGFDVKDKFYEWGTQRKGNLFTKDGTIVSWDTRPDGLQNIKIGSRTIEGADVFGYGSQLFYFLNGTYNFVSFFEHVEGLKKIGDIDPKESNDSMLKSNPEQSTQEVEKKLLATINGIEIYRNQNLPEGLNAFAHSSLPRDRSVEGVVEYRPGQYYFKFEGNYNYRELKTGQKLVTKIQAQIPLEFEAGNFSSIVLDSSNGPLITKSGGYFETYSGDGSRTVLVNKDKSLYYFVTKNLFVEAKSGKIYRMSDKEEWTNTLAEPLKILKDAIPNWSRLGEE